MTAIEHAEKFSDAMALAEGLFRRIRDETFDGVGVTRAAYGEGESAAASIIAEAAADSNLKISHDHAANLYVTLPGKDRSKTAVLIGSHLDSVPQGGNYDGLAGILAGLAVVTTLSRLGKTPSHDITVMGIRSEENAWFGAQHIGSRAALGLVPAQTLDEARRFDTGLTLAEHMASIGADVTEIRKGRRHLNVDDIGCYVELHIEQGPILEDASIPVGIVTGIRGNVRCAEARCLGAYGHSGAVSRKMRRDSVFAMSELVVEMDREWRRIEEEERDLVLTFGRFFTDPVAHSLTKVPGEVRFSFDARSHSRQTLEEIYQALRRLSEDIARRRNVTFDWGKFSWAEPAQMDRNLRKRLRKCCSSLDIDHMELPSSSGHDAGDFADAGIPSAMVFVRNANGSHNPDEHMSMDDFRKGTWILLEFVRSML